jgi:hypothetical protein
MLRADGAPSDIQIKDPSPDPTSIQRGGVLGVGLSVAGRKNDVFEARLSVANVEGKSVTWTLTDPNHFGHWYRSGQIPVGSKPGAATLTILVNGVTRMTRTFQVI